MTSTAITSRIEWPAAMTLRPIIEPQDLPLLETLYCSAQADSFNLPGWSDAQKQALLAAQFTLQHQAYGVQSATSLRSILHYEGHDMGCFYVNLSAPDWHLVDIVLLPAWRQRNLGRAILAALCGAAAAAGCGVTLQVAAINPALRLYQRLGFISQGGCDGAYWRLRWAAPETVLSGENESCLK